MVDEKEILQEEGKGNLRNGLEKEKYNFQKLLE